MDLRSPLQEHCVINREKLNVVCLSVKVNKGSKSELRFTRVHYSHLGLLPLVALLKAMDKGITER